MFSEEKLRKIILDLIEALDYDIYKSFLPETSEDPELAEDSMKELTEILKKHLTCSETEDI